MHGYGVKKSQEAEKPRKMVINMKRTYSSVHKGTITSCTKVKRTEGLLKTEALKSARRGPQRMLNTTAGGIVALINEGVVPVPVRNDSLAKAKQERTQNHFGKGPTQPQLISFRVKQRRHGGLRVAGWLWSCAGFW